VQQRNELRKLVKRGRSLSPEHCSPNQVCHILNPASAPRRGGRTATNSLDPAKYDLRVSRPVPRLRDTSYTLEIRNPPGPGTGSVSTTIS